jgi:hypothetical protein
LPSMFNASEQVFCGPDKIMGNIIWNFRERFCYYILARIPDEVGFATIILSFCYNSTNFFPIMFPASVSDEVGFATLVENCCYEVSGKVFFGPRRCLRQGQSATTEYYFWYEVSGELRQYL